ncbi:MAG: aminopeptidase N, partial [Planctomycetota bacterium]
MTPSTITPTAPPTPIFRKDYTEPDFWIDTVELRFELGEAETLVHSKLVMRVNDAVNDGSKALVLMGEM